MLEKYVSNSGAVVELSKPDTRFAKLSEKPSKDHVAVQGKWVLKGSKVSLAEVIASAGSVNELRDVLAKLLNKVTTLETQVAELVEVSNKGKKETDKE